MLLNISPEIQHTFNLFLLLKIINNYFIIIAILGVPFTVRVPLFHEWTFFMIRR